jgi:hypothetical protein
MEDTVKIAMIMKIIKDNEINCAEDIFQRDTLNSDAPELLCQICEIVGWAE